MMSLSLTAEEEVKLMLTVTTNGFDHRRDEVRGKGGWACLCVVVGGQCLNWLMGARTWNNAGGASGGFAAQNYKRGSRPAEPITA